MTTIIAEKEQEPALEDPRPFLKWVGGKGKLLAQYEPYFPKEFGKYFEPFLGGGAVFFHLQATRSMKDILLSDINERLIGVYRVVRDSCEYLVELLERHQSSHSKEYYYRVRDEYNSPYRRFDLSLERENAADFIYLNKTCFNGVYRENSSGAFNCPAGSYVNPKICDKEALQLAEKVLNQGWLSLRYMRFEVAVKKAVEGDFVYFDPPYFPLNSTSRFVSYSSNGFGEKDQIRLAEVFKELAKKGVKVMLSNSDCPEVRELYKDFQVVAISAPRSINSKGNKRGRVGEILAIANCS